MTEEVAVTTGSFPTSSEGPGCVPARPPDAPDWHMAPRARWRVCARLSRVCACRARRTGPRARPPSVPGKWPHYQQLCWPFGETSAERAGKTRACFKNGKHCIECVMLSVH